MERKYLKTLTDVMNQLKTLKSDVEKVKNGLQAKYDALSFEAQESEYGEELETILDSLETVLFDGFDTAEDELFNVVTSLKLLPNCDYGVEENEEDLKVLATAVKGGLFLGLMAKRNKKRSSRKNEDYNGYDDSDDDFV